MRKTKKNTERDKGFFVYFCRDIGDDKIFFTTTEPDFDGKRWGHDKHSDGRFQYCSYYIKKLFHLPEIREGQMIEVWNQTTQRRRDSKKELMLFALS